MEGRDWTTEKIVYTRRCIFQCTSIREYWFPPGLELAASILQACLHSTLITPSLINVDLVTQITLSRGEITVSPCSFFFFLFFFGSVLLGRKKGRSLFVPAIWRGERERERERERFLVETKRKVLIFRLMNNCPRGRKLINETMRELINFIWN